LKKSNIDAVQLNAVREYAKSLEDELEYAQDRLQATREENIVLVHQLRRIRETVGGERKHSHGQRMASTDDVIMNAVGPETVPDVCNESNHPRERREDRENKDL
jgi:hypothetical protein